MTDPDLARFVLAQAAVHAQVEEELRRGRKASHWMWFVFPQIQGLGLSETARHYAIRDLDQARRYLADPLLGGRLRQDVGLILRHADRPVRAILGSPDDLKFRSCLTLFSEAADDAADLALFAAALAAFYDGEADPRTLALLRGA